MKYLSSLLLCFLLLQAQATIRYVDLAATGANTGASWTDAALDIQSMLNASADGDTVFVAQGTYQPAPNTSYVIGHNNIKLFGGFTHGGNPILASRNPYLTPTMLNGDGNIPLFGNLSNNAGTMIIDGFQMTGAGSSTQGGIAYIMGSAIIQFSKCFFYRNNSTKQGGIFYINSSPVVIDNCQFYWNNSTEQGGIFYINSSNNAVISNCTFDSNTGSAEGEIFYISSCAPQINNSIFRNNNVTASGNLIFEIMGSPLITQCSFSNNAVPRASAIYLDFGSAIISKCNFLDNRIAEGLFYYNQATAQISHSVFANNTSSHVAILENYNSPGQSGFVNCVFYSNQATNNSYGGLFFNSSSALTIDNSTFYSNSSSGTSTSSLFHNSNSATSTFSNCIVTSNSFTTLSSVQSSSVPSFSYSIVQGITDPANFVNSVNPLFINPANPIGSDGLWGTADDGLELLSNSPAVDKGSNASIPTGITTDLASSPRIYNVIVDKGAYEYSPHPGPIVVTTTTNTSYSLQSPPVLVDNGVTVTDASNPTLASASIAITGNFSAGDVLAFSNSGSMGNITGSYNSVTGVLSLTSIGATASIAQWQAALQSITYSNSLASANLSNRTINFTVKDGTYQSNTATKIVVLVAASCTPTSSITNKSICASSLPYTWNGNSYNTSGSYIVHLTNAGGCDSAATLNLSTSSATSSITDQTICSASLPYSWNGNTFTNAGSYTVHLTNAGGCDSAATLNLSISSATSSTTNQTICASSLPYVWNGNTYNAAGSYTTHLTNIGGCDSTATLMLAVSTSNPSSTTKVIICSSALPYIWNGVSYHNFGTYTAHFASTGSCDSIATLNLINIGTSFSDSNRFSLILGPNPASSNLSVKVGFPCGIIVFNETPSIIIYNIIGQKLLQQPMPLDVLDINVSYLPRGLYVIKYMGNGFETAEKFFKW
ncbi:MAG: right-handed parallel beta-helix repeat-containing protein [Bacteroidetes bacterium]|nr:right-handed parallel beta-helix repeat-containing protein [Bacteroidota bacterium]